ncbi:hypothetical protein CEXT_144521 [Caerostris extrusa]|uniref:Uncharacterized protein n=1 Tax=Caerostris extrusa TaxID=172846 RepID=A0AAV4Y5L4_CAEEX|nr:hypothetical protein CEXT_144521 [Caerostris extrusa]
MSYYRLQVVAFDKRPDGQDPNLEFGARFPQLWQKQNPGSTQSVAVKGLMDGMKIEERTLHVKWILKIVVMSRVLRKSPHNAQTT